MTRYFFTIWMSRVTWEMALCVPRDRLRQHAVRALHGPFLQASSFSSSNPNFRFPTTIGCSAGSQTVLPTVRFSPATTVEFTAAASSNGSSAHDQVSVPLDPESGRALLNLEP